jgi:hypothetical protein
MDCKLKNRSKYQYHKYHQQTSLTVGSIFHGTKLPLNKWFLAIHLLTQRNEEHFGAAAFPRDRRELQHSLVYQA